MNRAKQGYTLYPPEIERIEAVLTDEPQTAKQLCAASGLGKKMVAILPRAADVRGWRKESIKVKGAKQPVYHYRKQVSQ
jgi:hypothetical protein